MDGQSFFMRLIPPHLLFRLPLVSKQFPSKAKKAKEVSFALSSNHSCHAARVSTHQSAVRENKKAHQDSVGFLLV
jgi:hypothetical protein